MNFTRLFALFLFIHCWYSSTIHAQNMDQWKTQANEEDGVVQINALLELNKYYNQVKLDSALYYGREALDHSKRMANDSLIGKSHGYLSLTFYYQRQMDSLIFHAQAGAQVAREINKKRLLAHCLKMEAVAYNRKGEFEKSIKVNAEVLAVNQSLKDTSGMAMSYGNLGATHQRSGVYDKALENFIKADQLFEQIDDINGRSLTSAQIGDLYLDMEDHNKGAFYTKKALSLTDKNDPNSQIRYGDLLISLGTIYHLDSTKLDSAIICFSESLALFESIGDQEGIAIGHNNLGNVYRDQKKYIAALFHARKSVAITNARPGEQNLTSQYKDLGRTLELSGQIDSAEHYYLKAYDESLEVPMALHQEKILHQLYLFYKKINKPSKALHYHELYTIYLEEKKGEAVQKEIAALQEKYESEKRDREIERLEFKSAVEVSKTNAFRIGLLALAIVAFLIIASILYRRRNEQKLFLLQQKMYEQEKKELDQELNFKTKQLTSHALHMVQKNEVLQELKMGISDLIKGSDTVQKKGLKSLIRRIDFNIQSDEDWNTFKLYFEQTNQKFYENLAKINKDLTSTELKLCSLIKLNMNIKETASVLNIEPTSVKTARHRLRKKLKLQQGQDLTSFIRQVA